MSYFFVNEENYILGRNIDAYTTNKHILQMYLNQIETNKSIVSVGIYNVIETHEKSIEGDDFTLKIFKSKTDQNTFIITTKFAMICLEEFAYWFIREATPSFDSTSKLLKYYRPNHNPKLENLRIDLEDLLVCIGKVLGTKKLDLVLFSLQVDYITGGWRQ